MKSNLFYKYATGILLLFNITLIIFFLVSKSSLPPPPQEGRLKDEIAKLLHLTEQQETTFRKYAEEHNHKITTLNQTQRAILRTYFQILKRDSSVTPQQSLLDKALHVERNKIQSTVKHFQQIKAMLKPQQKAHFKQFMDKVLDRILLSQKKNPPQAKGF